MGTRLSGQALVNKLTDFMDWLNQERQIYTTPPSLDQFHQIEKTLADTRPTRVLRSANRPVEPMTEQQKIMDLAG